MPDRDKEVILKRSKTTELARLGQKEYRDYSNVVPVFSCWQPLKIQSKSLYIFAPYDILSVEEKQKVTSKNSV